ncbi:MAG: HAD family phosphatase [Candidatus Palauibacterales bacterium]|nr:HAD family phosphatase [Candidatus Palauibacterales bacterium]MDP2528459.1 HAD family phosphatase [Candidatus Palauibacterales bacterium]MDP2584452.1 HAD family phosphatase [Candidatus Palauibacterales bacterium]
MTGPGATGGRAALLDMDGVLVATEGLKEQAHLRALASFGYEGTPGRALYRSVMGQPQDAVEHAYLVEAGLEGRVAGARYSERFRREYQELLHERLELVPGARALLVRLSEEGWRLALVSSSLRWMVELVLARAGLASFFEAVVTGDDVEHEKPAPDPYRAAFRALEGPEHLRAVVLEDTGAGIASGRAAGFPVIALRHGWNEELDLSGAGRVLTSLEDTGAVVGALEAALEAGPA